MAFSSGTFSRLYSWATDLASGAPNHFITASRMDAEMNGMATGLTACLLKDGSQTVTSNIPMATYRFTGLGAGSARTDSASMVDVQNAGSRHATSGGTNTVTLALSPASTAYAAGQAYNFKAGGTNTGAVTLNVNSLGAKAVQKNLAALVASDIVQNDIVTVVYDGTQFQMVSPARTPVLTANGIAGASVAIATATTRGSVEFATDAETITGTSTVLAVTPANVEAKVASATEKGIVELATNAEAITGTDTVRAITAANLLAANAIATTKGADIASGSPTVTTDGNYFDVSGTTTVAAWAVAADRHFYTQFDAALQLTHHATNLDLPGEANITTAAGDVAEWQSTGTNTCQCTSYTKADGTAVVVAAAGGGMTSVQTFTSSGTWTRPSGINSILVFCQAGGGGGAQGSGGVEGTSGGGGGGCAIEYIDVSSTASATVTVGAAGAGSTGSAKAAGAAGATSSFASLCSATGGAGGPGGAAANGGAGGVGSGGDINIGGGGGGGGSDNAAEPGGTGGSSFFGGGGPGPGDSGGAGGVALGYGGGGAGACGANNGGNGTAGIVYVLEYT